MNDFALIRQRLNVTRVADIPAAVREAFEATGAAARIAPGASIAITAGSRGIDAIADVLRAVAAEVRRLDARPFVTAAMGSHGGATDGGQREVLTGYGISEERIGCEIRSSMETVSLGVTPAGLEAFCDRNAYRADGIIVVGRVKPHSILTGDIGSGLLKMTAIGLGKQKGADSIHQHGLEANLVPTARRVIEKTPVAFGIALVENARDRLCVVEGVVPENFAAADRRLLREARANAPQLPFDPLDVLIVDYIGKDISGAGMDPNVIGMWRRNGGNPDRQIGRIVALDLTDGSHGNATGIGMADVTTRCLRSKINYDAMYMNAMTSNFLHGAKVPLTVATPRAAFDLACKPFDPKALRLVRIRDTAHLEYLFVSNALLAQIDDEFIERVDTASADWFDAEGEISAFPRPDDRAEAT